MALRFLGNKAKLVNEIVDIMIKITGLTKGSFIDLFSGTAIVSETMKIKGFDVISNDMLYSSFLLAQSKLLINSELTFTKLSNEVGNNIEQVIKYLNNLKGEHGFFTENYSPNEVNNEIGRKYFITENALKIDAIRKQINGWYKSNEITELERAYLISCLIYSVNDVANISGTYGAYLKKWNKNSLNQVELKPINITFSDGNYKVYNQDANLLAKSLVPADIVYIDPPYTKRQYSSYYHILETIARGDNPVIEGITGLRKDSSENTSKFCYKRHATNAMQELINSISANHIFVSYSTDGHISHEEMLELLGNKGEVDFWMKDYKRFKSNSLGNTDEKLKEILYYVKVCK